MPRAQVNGIELEYETHGDPEGDPLLLVSGLGSQLVNWPPALISGLAGRGFRVTCFDNRDVGRSTWFDTPGLDLGAAIATGFGGGPVDAPYRLSDMAADAVGLLDHLGVEAAHVVGASMGGMIAQTIAIEHPDRVLSLTSIMSTTGERRIGAASPEAAAVLVRPAARTREEAIAAGLETWRIIGTPGEFDEAERRRIQELAYDRGHNPVGVGRQLLAILASGSRADALRALDVPTLVLHGDADPLVGVSGGRRTAELVPGARYVELEGMGHDLPPSRLPRIVDEITDHARSAAQRAA